MTAALDTKEDLMAMTFNVDSTTGEGTFIRVLRDGRPFGKIFRRDYGAGAWPFESRTKNFARSRAMSSKDSRR
jgi:hypothetical protein